MKKQPNHFLTIGLTSQLEESLKGPYIQGRKLPRIALIGRSNVGKSSLINGLMERKGIAFTSSTPGKTRVLNFYEDPPNEVIWVDLPGYGFANVSREEQRNWEILIEKYLKEDHELRILLILIDSRNGPTDRDLESIPYFSKFSVPIGIVFTKVDGLKTQSERAKRKKEALEKLRSVGISVQSEKEVFWVSVKDQTGMKPLRSFLVSAAYEPNE